MMKTMKTMTAFFALGALSAALVGCNKLGLGGSASSDAAASAKPDSTAASASGSSVGAPECDDVLKKAADCKDKPGMSAITANRDNWKNGLANAQTKDATIQACKAAMLAVKAACEAQMPGGAASAGAAGSADSVGAPECDDVLKKAENCKDKPGMSAITANRANWKNGLANAASRDAIIQACKTTLEAVKAVGCDSEAGGAAGGSGWDGKSPYKCTGNDNATVTGVTANIASGPAITASGNCNVTFKDCTITTDKGISADGNAVVTLDGGQLKASGTAVDASGNAQVKVNRAKVSGKVHTLGNAKVTGIRRK